MFSWDDGTESQRGCYCVCVCVKYGCERRGSPGHKCSPGMGQRVREGVIVCVCVCV